MYSAWPLLRCEPGGPRRIAVHGRLAGKRAMLAAVRAAPARGLHPRRADPVAHPSRLHARAHVDDFADHLVARCLRIDVATVAPAWPTRRCSTSRTHAPSPAPAPARLPASALPALPRAGWPRHHDRLHLHCLLLVQPNAGPSLEKAHYHDNLANLYVTMKSAHQLKSGDLFSLNVFLAAATHLSFRTASVEPTSRRRRSVIRSRASSSAWAFACSIAPRAACR